MEIDMNENNWATPCPKYDCRKTACKCGLEYVNIPTSLGDDSEGSNVAPKNGAYCNALVFYEANGHVYIYTKEGVPTLIDVDASDISLLEQEVRKAQKDIHELREELDEFIHGFDTVADMKSTNTLSDGDYAETYGFYSLNDGGGAKYKIRTRTNSDVIDDMFIFQLLNNISLVAELMIEDELHTRQIGLKGDDTTDDTTKLNIFFDKSVNCNKRIIDRGIYKTTDAIFIKGIWRQNSGNNGQRRIEFDNATIHYTGTADHASVVLYNMFKYNVSGLCIARNSENNYVEIVGCWHLSYKDWDIQSLNIDNSTTNLAGKTYSTTANEYIAGNNIYVSGILTIGTTSGSYTNVVSFYNSIFNGTNNTHCVKLLGAGSKQNLQFFTCDLSYASNCVFSVDTAQTGGCSILCGGCYFDSGINIFENDDKKGVIFTSISNQLSANTNAEIQNILFTNYNKNMVVSNNSPFGNNLPIANVNYTVNGDLSYQSNQASNYDKFMGSSSGDWTKSYVADSRSINGKARRLTLNNGGNKGLEVVGVNAPRTDNYMVFIHFKVNTGTFTSFKLQFKNKYIEIPFSRIGNDEVVIVNNKDNVEVSEGATLNFHFDFIGAEAGLVVDFYELGVTAGGTYIPNMPLDSGAKLTAS